MQLLIANSLENYNSTISHHKDIVDAINKKKIMLNDLHTALMITKTLPVVAQYQKDYLPSTNPMENVSNKLDETIKNADSLLKN